MLKSIPTYTPLIQNDKGITLRIITLSLAITGLALSINSFAQTVITINNTDGINEGFNAPTPVTPVGNNPGTTLGEQRLFVFQRAAEIWGELINSDIPIVVNAQFSPQECSMMGSTLGSAGVNQVVADFPNAPLSNTFYPVALANSLEGRDLNDGSAEINATFNSDIDTGCSGADGWYYGIDGNTPANRIELLPVVLHEIAHGLGFTSFTNATTGAFLGDTPDIWSTFLFDLDQNQHWRNLTALQRQASAINDPNLVWNGPSVNQAFPSLLSAPQFTINSPSVIAGSITPTSAGFGPSIPLEGISRSVVLTNDGNGTDPTDACEPLINGIELNGNIALVRRGGCNFTVKSINAQNAGAVAVVIANNVPTNLPGLGGNEPLVNIPTVGIEQALGDAIQAQLPTPGVFASLALDQSMFTGTSQNFLRMNAPDPVEPGSSVSHWTPAAFPNLLMEPAISGSLFDNVDLTLNLFEDIGWSVNFPEAPGPSNTNIEPEGVYINTFSTTSPDQISGEETVLIRALENSNNQFSIVNLNGRGVIATISTNGEISIDPLGVVGSFSNTNTAQFTATGEVSTFRLQRVAMTDSEFLNFNGQVFPINPLYADNWTVNETVFNPSTGAIVQTSTPAQFDAILSRVSFNNGTQRLRSTQTLNGQFLSFSQGSLASQRDFVIQIGDQRNSSDLALQTLPGNQITLPVNVIGRGQFVDINTFTRTSLLENQPDAPPALDQDRLLFRQTLTRNNPILPGDFNRNGSIDNQDRSSIVNLYGLSDQDIDYNLLADIDNNGIIDLRDSSAVDGNITNVIPINNGLSGSWFNTSRSGEGWNIAILPGGQRAIIAFFSYATDGSTQVWIVGTGDVTNNEILFTDLNLTSGTVFGPAFDPNDVVRDLWGDIRVYFTDCNNGAISYSSDAAFGHDARPIQRLTTLAGVDCEQPNSTPSAIPAQVTTGSWFAPERDGEGWILEALDGNRVVLYWYTYDVSGGRQYWLGGVGTFDTASNSVQFDALNSTTGTQFGDAFSSEDVIQVPWGSATFQQTNCNNGTFSFNSNIPGFGNNTYNLTRLTGVNGINCNAQQFLP